MLPVKCIVCPTDFSAASLAAVAAARETAAHFGARVVLLHVSPFSPAFPTDLVVIAAPGESDAEHIARMSAQLDELAAENMGAVEYDVEVRQGSAPHEIACAATDAHADLIVLSTHGHSGWRHLAFGSVAEAVLRRAPCPVLVVRAPEGT